MSFQMLITECIVWKLKIRGSAEI